MSLFTITGPKITILLCAPTSPFLVYFMNYFYLCFIFLSVPCTGQSRWIYCPVCWRGSEDHILLFATTANIDFCFKEDRVYWEQADWTCCWKCCRRSRSFGYGFCTCMMERTEWKWGSILPFPFHFDREYIVLFIFRHF